MSAADPEVWIHVASGYRFALLHDCGDHGATGRHRHVLVRHLHAGRNNGVEIELPRRILDAWFLREDPNGDDVMALADAIGAVAPAIRQPGQPLLVEYAAGPAGPGPLWDDDRLWDDFDRADRLGGPGGAR